MTNPRGSEWAIWDLHVHTPASIVQQYGGDQADVWDRYLTALAALPSNIRVLGINDYWFVDGYRQVQDAWSRGDLPNIDLLVPVVEMRLDILGGTEAKLSKQNLHVLFDPEISADLIEAQFLAALTAGFKLSSDAAGGTWSGVVTRDSLRDLGTAVLESAPPEMRAQMGSPLFVGFSNLVMSRERLHEVLHSSYFVDRTMLALGKAEWSDMRWSQSAALKRDLVEGADLLFTAFPDPERWAPAVESLRQQNFAARLLDCSDAHHWADSDQDARLGNCLNWVNAEASFSGLRHALAEFDHRIFVGVVPQHVQSVNRYPDRYVESISVRPASPEGEFHSFDYSLPLNSQFVAIVGNKGQGKSALLDCIALAGGSPRRKDFAFLNESRFLASRTGREVDAYVATLAWKNGSTSSANLSAARESFDGEVQVEYLPQAFVERVCTARPNSDAARDFEAELKKVLFSHIEEEQRAGAATFDQLQEKRTGALSIELSRLRDLLADDVETLIGLAQFQRSHPVAGIRADLNRMKAAVDQASSALLAAQEELAAADAGARDEAEVVARRQHAEAVEARRSTLLEERATIMAELAAVRGTELELDAISARVDGLAHEVEETNNQLLSGVYSVLGIEPQESPVVRLSSSEDWHAITSRRRTMEVGRLTALQVILDSQLEELQKELTDVGRELAQIDAVREGARQQVRDRQAHLDGLRGTVNDPQSLLGLEALSVRREATPGKIREVQDRLIDRSRAIHLNLSTTSAAIAELFAPVERFAAESESLSRTEIRTNVSLDADSKVHALEDSIDRRRSSALLPAILEFPRSDLSDWDSMEGELRRLLTLAVGTPESPLDAESHFKMGYTAAGFLADVLGLTWVRQRVELLSGDSPLSSLSPGQRGLVLLLFYLLIDQGRIPLILDQPEENLDNDTVAGVVVPALREAAKRRQVIVVTHNANLAVVGDADQVVECTYSEGTFGLSSGPISEMDTAVAAVRVLEGTKSALENRYGKFRAVPAQ